jgi:hypothetical protein
MENIELMVELMTHTRHVLQRPFVKRQNRSAISDKSFFFLQLQER